jgi:hypothetical protein
MQDKRHRRTGRLLALVAGFDTAGRAGQDDIWHVSGFSEGRLNSVLMGITQAEQEEIH